MSKNEWAVDSENQNGKRKIFVGELKDDVIDRLQNYYGIMIRSNVGNLKSMKSAVLLHYSMLHPLLKMYGMTIGQKVLVAGVCYLTKQVCINQV